MDNCTWGHSDHRHRLDVAWETEGRLINFKGLAVAGQYLPGRAALQTRTHDPEESDSGWEMAESTVCYHMLSPELQNKPQGFHSGEQMNHLVIASSS